MVANKEFAEMIKGGRERRGLSQTRVAELVGRSAATVKAWERGQSSPTDTEVLSSLAAILGLVEGEVFRAAGVELPGAVEQPTIEQALLEIAPPDFRRRHMEGQTGVASEPPEEPTHPMTSRGGDLPPEVAVSSDQPLPSTFSGALPAGDPTGGEAEVDLARTRNTMLEPLPSRRTLRQELPTAAVSLSTATRGLGSGAKDALAKTVVTAAGSLGAATRKLGSEAGAVLAKTVVTATEAWERLRKGRQVANPSQPVHSVSASPSYMEDLEARKVYDLRRVYTAVAMTVVIVLTLWAFRKSREAMDALLDLLIPEI